MTRNAFLLLEDGTLFYGNSQGEVGLKLLRLRRRKTSTYQDPDLSGLLEEEQKRHAYYMQLLSSIPNRAIFQSVNIMSISQSLNLSIFFVCLFVIFATCLTALVPARG